MKCSYGRWRFDFEDNLSEKYSTVINSISCLRDYKFDKPLA